MLPISGGSRNEREGGAIAYRPDIDGLRAVAVISVVAYHCGVRWFEGGFVGVDIFFVISGYLIGTLVYKEIRGGTFSLGRFYARRAKRILPALFAIVLFCYAAGALLLSPIELRGLGGTAIATIGSVSNFQFFRHDLDYFHPDTNLNPLLMTWTLGGEEQFYLLFPMLMLLMRGRRWQSQMLVLGGTAAASMALNIWMSARYPVFAFYMLPTRAWELAAGVLLAMIEATRQNDTRVLPRFGAHALSALGIALIVISTAGLDKQQMPGGFGAFLPVVGAVLLILTRDGMINRVLGLRPIVFVGLISYSWYLWHWPLLSFAHLAAGENLRAGVAGAIGVLSFGCAVLSYCLLERPFRQSMTRPKKLLWRYGGLAFVMMMPGTVFFLSNGLPQRNRAAQELDRAATEEQFDPCQVSEVGSHLVLEPPCIPAGNGRAVALIGDSHAAEMAGALREIAAADNYSMVELIRTNCPPVGAGVARTDKDFPWLVSECNRFNQERLSYIERDKSIEVVIAASWWAEGLRAGRDAERYTTGQEAASVTVAQSRALLKSGLEAMVQRMTQAGKTVYLVQDNAEFSFDPLLLMKRRIMEPRRKIADLIAPSGTRPQGDFATASDTEANDAGRRVVGEIGKEFPGVVTIDLRSALCSAARCQFADGDRTLYSDQDHLTTQGARVALAGFKLPK